jgi:hypothetical protein
VISVRKTFIYDVDKKCMVEKPETPLPKFHHVMNDIDDYRVVGPEYGKVITSRSRHREYLKKHQLIEVGNERGPIHSKSD